MRIIQLKVDDILEKIIEEIKLESGFATDQEFLRKVIEEYHVRANQATVESSNSPFDKLKAYFSNEVPSNIVFILLYLSTSVDS